MKLNKSTAVVICFCLFSLGFTCGAAISRGLPEEQASRVAEIPLTEIVTTSTQQGLKRFGEQIAGIEKESTEMAMVASNLGASNVFLVRGNDAKSAILATCRIFTAGRNVEYPVAADPNSNSDEYWLVAFMGCAGSSPPQWEVATVQKHGAAMRIVFQPLPLESSQDVLAYFFWVPVGKLAKGQYRLELIRQEQEQPMLVRTVTVP